MSWDKGGIARKHGMMYGQTQKRYCPDKFGGYKTEVKETIETRDRLAPRNKVKEEEHLRDLLEVKRRHRNENVFARPNGLRESAQTAISCRVPTWTCQKEERGIPLVQRRRKKTHRCVLVAKQ